MALKHSNRQQQWWWWWWQGKREWGEIKSGIEEKGGNEEQRKRHTIRMGQGHKGEWRQRESWQEMGRGGGGRRKATPMGGGGGAKGDAKSGKGGEN